MQLSRSAVPSQRASALRAIERIIYKSRHYHYVLPTHPPGLPVLVNELVISYLLDQAYVATALRYAVDDKNPSIMLLALKALHSLLYSEFGTYHNIYCSNILTLTKLALHRRAGVRQYRTDVERTRKLSFITNCS